MKTRLGRVKILPELFFWHSSHKSRNISRQIFHKTIKLFLLPENHFFSRRARDLRNLPAHIQAPGQQMAHYSKAHQSNLRRAKSKNEGGKNVIDDAAT